MKKVILICSNCGESFERNKKEYDRNKKIGRDIFCSRSCAVSYENKKRKNKPLTNGRKKHIENLKEINRKRERPYSPFKFFSRISKRRNKAHEIDAVYLKEVWDKQEGICPYTGVKLFLPPNSGGYNKHNDFLHAASLDRIDSSKGYEKGNLQFVSKMANYAKNSCSHEEMIEFCKVIAEKWK